MDHTGSPPSERHLSGVERRALEAICDAMVPSSGSGDGAVELGVPAEIERWIASFSPSSRQAVRAMLIGYNYSPLLSRHLRPFTRLSPADRSAWVDASGNRRFRARREAFSGLQTLVQIAYASHPRVAQAIGYDGSPLLPLAERPAPSALPVRSWPDVETSIEVDVVIVGSGAGGAVAAHTLAQIGRAHV